MDKKTGLVAFFDILGYQNFLDKNEPEIAAEKISELIKKLKAFQSETFINLFKEKKREKAKSVIENIVYLVISDAILLTLETDKSDQERYKRDQLIFFMYCSRFFKELFVYGLPPRGAIEYGDYILVESQMFAGRPIVSAYQSAMQLDLSVCQVSDSVGNLPPDLRNIIYTNYNTPLRTGEEKELVLLMPFTLRDDKKDECTLKGIADLEQFIMGSFSAHNKMINKEVQKKMLNTEFFLRYCKTRFK